VCSIGALDVEDCGESPLPARFVSVTTEFDLGRFASHTTDMTESVEVVYDAGRLQMFQNKGLSSHCSSRTL
jgi:hypothetical protein